MEADMPDPAPDPGAAAGGTPRQAALMREVRLGLVCYGGVSLAIYMHGVTKELYKLVRAARAFERAYEANGNTATGDEDPDQWLTGPAQAQGAPNYDTERAYFRALTTLAANGTPLTVNLDVIAGTSAGGINGVCLARGLAEGRSLNGFKELWVDDADLDKLLAGRALFPWGRGKMLSKLAESAIRLGWHQNEALLNGDLMTRLLYSALDGMDQVENSLVPGDESLDLFVTTTNVYGYDTAIPTGAGGISHTDKSYRQLLHFRYDPPPPGTGPAGGDFSDVPALAFAARATASFPGAFPPVSLGSFAGALGHQAGLQPGAAARIPRYFVYGLEYGAQEAGQWFMDGGVLDNGPFDHVLDAIAAKRADGQTAREIIYIQPDPGPPPQPDQRAPDRRPGFVKTVLAARITIPQHTPLVAVFGAWARQQPAWQAGEPDVLEDRLGDVDVPFRLRRAEFVLQGINKLFGAVPPGMPATRVQLSAMKSATWDLIAGLRALQQQVAADVHGQASALFGPQALTQGGYLANPETFAGTGAGGHGTELSGLYAACLEAVRQRGVTGSSQDLWQALTGHTQTWKPDARTWLLSRYVGFPIWDALIFPVISLARLPQLAPISVQRFSPLDATCLTAVDSNGKPRNAKLDGTAISHFGAFFEKAWRENDYLWGRLDGAELVMRLLSRQSGRRQSGAATDLTAPLRSALTAILDGEQAALGQIGPVCQALAAQVKDITSMEPNGPAA